MTYVSDNLQPHEELIYETKLHWVIFSSALFAFIIAMALFIFGPYNDYTNMVILNFPATYKLLGLFALAYAIYSAILNYLHFCLIEYAITNQRVVIKHGIIYRTVEVIILEKIESLQVNQSILARILKYGDVIILGTGGSQDILKNVEYPMLFRRLLNEQIENHLPHGDHE